MALLRVIGVRITDKLLFIAKLPKYGFTEASIVYTI